MNTLATRKQSQAIRQRMQSIRNELPYAMDDAREELKQLTDWKYYIRKLPLTSVAVAATAAYLVVPKKSTPKKSQGHAEVKEEVVESSFFGGLLGAAAAMALRTGTSMAVRHISGSLFGSTTARR